MDRIFISQESLHTLLLSCRKSKDLPQLRQLHFHICLLGLDAHEEIGNYIVPAYVDCGETQDAQHLFHNLSNSNEFSWTSLIQSYLQLGDLQTAVSMFHQMQQNHSILPSSYTYVAVCKACARLKVIETNYDVHMEIVKRGLDMDAFLGNTLVDLYARSGSLSEAKKLFDLLPCQIDVSWNTLITGYADCGLPEEALNCFEEMQSAGVVPNIITFICSLKASSSLKVISKCNEIHEGIIFQGLDKDPSIEATLIDTYAKCSLLWEADGLLRHSSFHCVVSWNALIAGYVEHGLGSKALECLLKMQDSGVFPNSVTFVSLLKACTVMENLNSGRDLYALIVTIGLENMSSVGNCLIDMYAKFGSNKEAKHIFDRLPTRCIVSWTALITGYAEHGLHIEVHDFLKCMQEEGFAPDAATYVSTLKACASLEAIETCHGIHAMIVMTGLENNIFVGNTLIDTYIKSNSLVEAEVVFNQLTSPNMVSWNTIITGYVENGFLKQALSMITQMEDDLMLLDTTTYICGLKACSNLKAPSKGHKIHADIIKRGLETDIIVGNSMVDTYAKCGLLLESKNVFNLLPSRNTVSWNTLITGYLENGLQKEAMKYIELMQSEKQTSDITTYVCSLRICSSIENVNAGQKYHVETIMKGLEGHPFVVTSLVDMYSNCGLLTEAEELFNQMSVQNIVTWTALIAGYTKHNLSLEALKCLEVMQDGDTLPNVVTYGCALKACSCISALVKGQCLHSQITKRGFQAISIASINKCGEVDNFDLQVDDKSVNVDGFIANSLIDMYCKCGSMKDAQKVFDDQTLTRDVMAWNILMTGYSHNGQTEHVLHLFKHAVDQGIYANEAMFLTLLSVCSHGGLVDLGQAWFKRMVDEYIIYPSVENYNCMVDLLSRAGQLHKAITVLENMPFHPDLVTWSTLLAACQNCGEVELGRQCFEWVARLDRYNAASFIVLYNIYEDSNTWDDAKEVRALEQVMSRAVNEWFV